MPIIIPRQDRQGIFWLEEVRRRRVVYNDDVLHVPPQLSHVFDEDTIIKSAVLSEQVIVAERILIKHFHQGFSIFAQTCSIDDKFIVFRKFFNKRESARPHQHIHIADLPFNIDWEDNVCLLWGFERRMDESLIKVEDQSLLQDVLIRQRSQQAGTQLV